MNLTFSVMYTSLPTTSRCISSTFRQRSCLEANPVVLQGTILGTLYACPRTPGSTFREILKLPYTRRELLARYDTCS